MPHTGPVLCERHGNVSRRCSDLRVRLNKQKRRHWTTSAGQGRHLDESVQPMAKLIGYLSSAFPYYDLGATRIVMARCDLLQMSFWFWLFYFGCQLSIIIIEEDGPLIGCLRNYLKPKHAREHPGLDPAASKVSGQRPGLQRQGSSCGRNNRWCVFQGIPLLPKEQVAVSMSCAEMCLQRCGGLLAIIQVDATCRDWLSALRFRQDEVKTVQTGGRPPKLERMD
jgi:hypothetical protein